MDSHRIEEAVDLADQQRKKLQGNVTVDEDEVKILRNMSGLAIYNYVL